MIVKITYDPVKRAKTIEDRDIDFLEAATSRLRIVGLIMATIAMYLL